MLFVTDTNLLRPPYSRRMLAVIAATQGERIGIVPSVADEAKRGIAANALYYESRRARLRGAVVPPDVEQRLRTTVAAWVDAQIASEDGPYALACGTVSERLEARRLAMLGMPDDCFDSPEDDSDRVILAEAMVGGARHVLTNNMATIDHDRLNAWHAERTGSNEPLVLSAHAGTGLWFGGIDQDGSALARGVLAMSISDRGRSDSEELRSARAFLRNASSQFQHAAALASAWLFERCCCDPRDLLPEARTLASSRPWSRCRAAERDLRDRVRSVMGQTAGLGDSTDGVQR